MAMARILRRQTGNAVISTQAFAIGCYGEEARRRASPLPLNKGRAMSVARKMAPTCGRRSCGEQSVYLFAQVY
jgi:hypothetical protein